MELNIATKGNKYLVSDKGQGRHIYTMKKKGFGGGKYVLLDASDYQLYGFQQVEEGQKPRFVISNNGNSILHITCKSLFLDPTLMVEGRDLSGNQIKYAIQSKDHKNFEIMRGEEKIGSLAVKVSMSNELQYDLEINDKCFDDYIAFFALAADLTFGEMNKK